MSEQNELCPVCGMGHLHRQIEKAAFEYKGVQLEAEDYFDVCNVCGTEQATENLIRDAVRAKQRARKRHDGLLLGEEIRRIREQLGLTQKVAQELFGTGPVSFSKYEHDDVLHSKLLDRTLRLMHEDPAYLQAFAQFAELPLPARREPLAIQSDDLFKAYVQASPRPSQPPRQIPPCANDEQYLRYSQRNGAPAVVTKPEWAIERVS